MRFLDTITVRIFGGVRVRLGANESYVLGKMQGLPPERMLQIIRDLAPGGVGVVHINRNGQRWTISFRGVGFVDGFEQRLRNVLVNS